MAFPFDQLRGLLKRTPPITRPAPRHATRAYKAASPRPRDLRDAWQGPINNELSAAKARMDGRARFCFPNDPYATAAVEAWVTTAVGAGVKPRYQGRGAERLHALWHSQGRNADADGRCDIYGLQALTFRQIILTGEAFLAKVFRNGLQQWRLIPSAMVPTDKSQTLPAGGRIIQGVELDSNNYRVAYHIHKHQPGEIMGLPSETVRVPASDVLHVFVPLEAGQNRGVTWFAPVIAKLHELGAIEEAELVRMKVQCLFGGYIKTLDITEPTIEDEHEAALLDPYEEELGSIGHMEPGTLYKLADGGRHQLPPSRRQS